MSCLFHTPLVADTTIMAALTRLRSLVCDVQLRISFGFKDNMSNNKNRTYDLDFRWSPIVSLWVSLLMDRSAWTSVSPTQHNNTEILKESQVCSDAFLRDEALDVFCLNYNVELRLNCCYSWFTDKLALKARWSQVSDLEFDLIKSWL